MVSTLGTTGVDGSDLWWAQSCQKVVLVPDPDVGWGAHHCLFGVTLAIADDFQPSQLEGECSSGFDSEEEEDWEPAVETRQRAHEAQQHRLQERFSWAQPVSAISAVASTATLPAAGGRTSVRRATLAAAAGVQAGQVVVGVNRTLLAQKAAANAFCSRQVAVLETWGQALQVRGHIIFHARNNM